MPFSYVCALQVNEEPFRSYRLQHGAYVDSWRALSQRDPWCQFTVRYCKQPYRNTNLQLYVTIPRNATCIIDVIDVVHVIYDNFKSLTDMTAETAVTTLS